MSYRVDIPTLSANEVYTLTFEYEGTETIQLIVGDLTLETTDRRVVFTTTSPVNYIESNVNLTNLNMYEGYYEGDDFGGEYTQESYIEGKSLVNLLRCDVQNKNEGSASVKLENIDENGRYVLTATGASSGWQNLDGTGNAEWNEVYGTYTVVLDIVECTCKDIKDAWYSGNQSASVKYQGLEYNGGASVKHIWLIETTESKGFGMRYAIGATTQAGRIVVGAMIVKGDYFDEFCTGESVNVWQGIGCVKSPKILSQTKHRNIMLNTKPHSKTNLITVSDDNTYIYLAEAARYSGLNFKFTQEYLAQHGISNGDKLCIELDGRLIEGTGTQAAKTSTKIGVDACAWSDGLSGLNTVYKNLPENGHFCDYITINGNAGTIGLVFLNNEDWSGTNRIYEVRNLRVYKVEDTSEVGTYDCCKISTPDDLELYKVSDTIYDKLDLTTGTLYKNTGTYVLDETFVDRTSNWEVSIHDTTGNVTFTSRQHKYLRDEHNFPGSLYNNAIVSNADPASNIVNNNNIKITRPRLYFDVYSNNNYTVIIMPASYNVTTLEELRTWLQNNPMIFNYKLGTPYTEQLSLNPPKSYCNGSITTSSQELTPTLKTTLPISNKFTTTNLTSGSTYNVYFDGTATKLDAGGTIITNPVSPCEVECGGTTLTIEGTDIQNVRVLETTVKNEVGSVCGTTDVELSKVITSDLEVITNDIKFSSASTNNGNINTVDNKLGTINTKGGHSWGAGSFTSNKTYPKGFSLLHVEFDVDMPSDNLMAIINFNNNVGNTYYNFRDLTLDNDTATIAQGQTSGTGVRYSSIVTKGHFSRLMYCFSSQGKINLNINTGSSGMITASGNSAEGSTSGYTACASNGVTISNFKIKVIENYPDTTTSSQITSSLRTDNGLTVIWQDMDMSIGQSISDLEQPIKLRSLGTTYDSYNPITGELTKRIGVSETDGSYSVLSSPIVSQVMKVETLTNVFPYLTNVVGDATKIGVGNATYDEDNWVYFQDKAGYQNITYIDMSNFKPNTDYTWFVEVKNNTLDGVLNLSMEYSTSVFDDTQIPVGFNGLLILKKKTKADFTSLQRSFIIQKWHTVRGTIDFRITIVEGDYTRTTVPHFIGTQNVVFPVNQPETPHLYTNGQVKVYSDSEVYPTTILNGQSTNNYEVNELNKSNDYTIRYDGTCESINLNGKSNEQGTNRIVKTSTNGSGNLTFVNNSEDIDNVLLVQNDVREQEINHFNGLQTVEINQLFVSNKQNLFEAYMKNDFEFLNNANWGAQAYGSLHNGVFKCGNLSAGSNLQWAWNLIRPRVSGNDYVAKESKEDNPIVLANKVYNISFNISIVDHHTIDKNHNYIIRAFDFDGNEVSVQKATGGQAFLSTWSNGVTNPTTTNFINLDVIFSKDIYCFALHANYGGQWAFDCTITDFTICEPENAKPDVPLIYEYIDLPQPVQLNSLPDGTCDTYNPITGEYVQNVGYFVLDDTFASRWLIVKTKDGKPVAQRDLSTQEPNYSTLVRDYSFPSELYDYQAGTKAIANIPLAYNIDHTSSNIATPSLYGATYFGNHYIRIALPFTPNDLDQWNYSYIRVNDWLRENPIHIAYKRTEPITTQLTPINIPTFEGGIVQLITTDGKVFPMIEYSMPTNNRYDTLSWEAGAVYTQRNMTEVYFNDSTTPMTPTETTTLTTDHISSGSIILNDNGNGLIVLKGNYTGRDIPYFTGMRSVESIEIETTPSPDQPLFGKGGRR